MYEKFDQKLKILFWDQVKHNKEIAKEDIYGFLLDRGIECKSTLAKEKMLELIRDNGFENDFASEFLEFVYIPSWTVADHFGLRRQDIDMLYDIGVIKETIKEDTYYSKKGKCDIGYRAYPIETLLNYTPEQLHAACERAYPESSYALRIETRTKEETMYITDKLQKIFLMKTAPSTYEHRNNNGYYTYYHVQLVNNTEEQENRFLKEIAELKQQLKDKNEKIRELQSQLGDSRLRQQALNDVWRDDERQKREEWNKYADERYNRGFEQGIQEERKKRNAGRKKNPFLEEEYFATAQEIQRLLDMGHTMKEIIENGMITKVNPKTKQIEPVSKSTIYRCMKLYKSSTK